MRTHLLRTTAFYAPEGAGGGGGGGDGAAAAAAAAAAAKASGQSDPAGGGGGQDPKPPAVVAPYRPEGLPDHLFGGPDAGDKGTIDKLWKTAAGYQTRISQFGEIPEKADAYAFEPGDKVKPYAGELKGKLWDDVRTAAQKSGIGTKQFNGFMNGVLEAMIEGEIVEAPFDPEAEKKALLPESAKDLPAPEQAAAIDKRMRENMAWIEAMKARAPAGQSEAIGKALDFVLAELGDRANGHIAIEFLRGQIGAGAQPSAGGGGGGGFSREDLQKRQGDPRNDPHSPKYEPAYAQETMRLYQATFK